MIARWHQPRPQQIELGASIHLAFDELQLRDLSFRLPVGPGLHDSGLHGIPVVAQAIRKRTKRSFPGFVDPCGELEVFLLPDDPVESVGKISNDDERRHGGFNRRDKRGF